MSAKGAQTSTASSEHKRRYLQRQRSGMQCVKVLLSESDLDVLVRKGYFHRSESNSAGNASPPRQRLRSAMQTRHRGAAAVASETFR
jgi:hypothetical protein